MKTADPITMEDTRPTHQQDTNPDGNLGAADGRRVEARAHPRFRVRGAAVDVRSSAVFSVSGPAAQWKRAQLVDLSVAGLQVIAPFRVNAGDRIRIAIEVPTRNQPILARAIVQWAKCLPHGRGVVYRAGLAFSQLHPRQRTVIEALAREELFGDTPATLKLAATGLARPSTVNPMPCAR